MKVELDKDPLFLKKQTFIQELKLGKLEKSRKKHVRNPSTPNELNIEVVDPLPGELNKYKHRLQVKKGYESSIASSNLKKYITEQERNLKYLRMERYETEPDMSPTKAKFHLNLKRAPETAEGPKQTDIPKIEEFFSNQYVDHFLHESSMLGLSLEKAKEIIASSLNNPLLKLPENTERLTRSERLPSVVYNPHDLEEEVEIDKIVEKRHRLIVKMLDRLQKEKQQIRGASEGHGRESKSVSFFVSKPQKARRKVLLKGIKSVSCLDDNQKIKVMPASKLLFEIKRLSNNKNRKETELRDILLNSLQNREEILHQKSDFYEQETPLNQLSPSNQFKLRKLMDRRLEHRLELSREQVNRFVHYLSEIKSYHLLINDTVLELLKEVRTVLLKGKVMKVSDFHEILLRMDKNQLKGHPNELIVQNLEDMMV